MSSTVCLRLKSPKSTNYCQVTGSLLPRTPAELQFLFTGTIETKRSVTTLPRDTHDCRRTIVFVAISLRYPACIWFNAYVPPEGESYLVCRLLLVKKMTTGLL